jgi:Zn finger protein HypA/HybF involved in hydrogenase expression
MTELICQDCGREYQPSSENMACPKCASTNVKVKAGEEFFLEAIDVDE